MRSNSGKEAKEGAQCTICLERAANCSINGCSHEFCLKCIKRWARTKNNCPLCRERFIKIETRNRVLQVQPVPERVRPPRPSLPQSQPNQRNMFYMPLLLYSRPSCFFYPAQNGIFMAPNLPQLPSIPLGTPSFFVPSP